MQAGSFRFPLTSAAMAAAVLLVAACAGNEEPNGRAAPASSPATPAGAPPVQAADRQPAAPAAPTVAAALAALPTATPAPASCASTRPDGLGPFYVPNAPQRASVGRGHVLSGVVRSSAGCSPIAGARIEFWLAAPNGRYDDDHRATMFSDTAGTYRFESNFPPPYSGRPPHIHVRVTADGYQPLVTQYYPARGQTEGAFDLVLDPSG